MDGLWMIFDCVKRNNTNMYSNIRPDGKSIAGGETVVYDPEHFDNKISTEHTAIPSHDQSISTRDPEVSAIQRFKFDRNDLPMPIQTDDQSNTGGETV